MDNNQLNGFDKTDVNAYADQPVKNPYEASQDMSVNNPYVYTESWMNNNYKGNSNFNPYQLPVMQLPVMQSQSTAQTGAGYYYMPQASGMQLQTGTGSAGLAIAGMVCGIVSIVLCCFWGVSLFAAVPGLIMSIVALTKSSKGRGMAVAGVICSSFGIILFILYTLALFMG